MTATASGPARDDHADDGTPELDPAMIDGIIELGGADLVDELLVLSRADIVAQISELERAVADHDAPLARRAAHAISGSSGNIGAVRLGVTSARLEQLAATGDLTGADGLVAELASGWTRVRDAIDRRRGELLPSPSAHRAEPPHTVPVIGDPP